MHESSNGRTTPGSRSPSPVDGRTSPLAAAYKTIPAPSRKLPAVSSSPHLVGICEEGEEATSEENRTRNSPQTYSSIRMIRPRRAVVSPDVVRRYDKRSSGRSRRSTSCSSSEASDDEERRLSLIHTRHCGRRDRRSGNDDDSDPPSGGCGSGSGGGGEYSRANSNTAAANGEGKCSRTKLSAGDRSKSTADDERRLDARKLASKLRKLALAPIRETPGLILSKFGRAGDGRRLLADETRRWFKPLVKPKSCEHLDSSPDDYRKPLAAADDDRKLTKLKQKKKKKFHWPVVVCLEPTTVCGSAKRRR